MTHNESSQTCACGGSCSCQDSSEQTEHIYLTREEYVSRLEQYLVELKTEIESVEKELMQLKEPVVMAKG